MTRFNESGIHRIITTLTVGEQLLKRVEARDVDNHRLRAFGMAVEAKIRGVYFMHSGFSELYVCILGSPIVAAKLFIGTAWNGGNTVEEYTVTSDFVANGVAGNKNFFVKKSKHIKTAVKNVAKAVRVHSMETLAAAWTTGLNNASGAEASTLRRQTVRAMGKITNENYPSTAFISGFATELRGIVDSGYLFRTPAFRDNVPDFLALEAQFMEEQDAKMKHFYFVVISCEHGVVRHIKWAEMDGQRMVAGTDCICTPDELPEFLSSKLTIMAMATEDSPFIDGVGYMVAPDIVYVSR